MGAQGLPRECRGKLLGSSFLAQWERRGHARIWHFQRPPGQRLPGGAYMLKARVRSPLVLSLRARSQQQKLKGCLVGERLKLEAD